MAVPGVPNAVFSCNEPITAPLAGRYYYTHLKFPLGWARSAVRNLVRMRYAYYKSWLFFLSTEVLPFYAELQTDTDNGVFNDKVKIFSATQSEPNVWVKTYYGVNPTTFLLETTEVLVTVLQLHHDHINTCTIVIYI